MQTANVLSFFRRPNGGDWSQAELAAFYRVEGALVQAGLPVAGDRGITDEGEPWFVFCRQDNEEIIAHFARIDGEYVIVSSFAPGASRGRDLHALVRDLLDGHSYILPRSNSIRQTVYLHPAAVLAALVATAFIKSSELHDDANEAARPENASWLSARHDFAFLSAAAAAISGLCACNELGLFDHKIIDPTWLHNAGNSDHAISNAVLAAPENVALADIASQGIIDFGALTTALQSSADRSFDHTDSTGVAKSAVVPPVKLLGNDAAPVELQLSHPSHDDNAKSVVQQDDMHLGENGTGASFYELSTIGRDIQASAATLADFKGPSGSSHTPGETAQSTPAASFSILDIGAVTTPNVALQIATADGHIDHLVKQSAILTVTSLQDAVRDTLPTAGPDSAATINAAQLPQMSGSSPSFDHSALQALENFLRDTKTVKIETFGPDMLIADANGSHLSSGHVEVDTWKMSDGSTLSILGVIHLHPEAIAA